LFVNIWVAVIGSFLTIDARMGRFTKYLVLLAGPLFFPGPARGLGLKWNKIEDTLQVDFPTVPAVLTKRGVLAYLAKVYDPLGLISPMMLEGKIIYREICEEKIRWDGSIPDELSKQWLKWESAFPSCLSFSRCIPVYREPIQQVQLHSFEDASKKGVYAAVYAVVQQESGTVQGLVAAKSRLAKTNLTIPRLELVAGHMAVNLAVNVRNARDFSRRKHPMLAR
jgi:hypothetical protein